MGNCLVTKLKENVQNESLLKLGMCKVTFVTSNEAPLHLTIDGNGVISSSEVLNYTINGDAASGNSIAYNGYTDIFITLPASSSISLIIPKYDLIRLAVAASEIQFKELRNTKMVEFVCRGTLVGVSVNNVISSMVEKIIGAFDTAGTINGLNGVTTLTEVSISNSNPTSGDVISLKDSIGIQVLEIQNTQTSGSLNDLFDEWASAGKTGDMLLSFNGSNCTLTGVTTYADNKVTFSNGSWSVSQW